MLQLIVSDKFSKLICDVCKRKLSEYSAFQSTLFSNHRRLYLFEIRGANRIIIDSARIKTSHTIDDRCPSEKAVEGLIKSECQEDFGLLTGKSVSNKNNETMEETTVSENETFEPIISSRFKCAICEELFPERFSLVQHLIFVSKNIFSLRFKFLYANLI